MPATGRTTNRRARSATLATARGWTGKTSARVWPWVRLLRTDLGMLVRGRPKGSLARHCGAGTRELPMSYLPREVFADAIVAYAAQRSVELKARLHSGSWFTAARACCTWPETSLCLRLQVGMGGASLSIRRCARSLLLSRRATRGGEGSGGAARELRSDRSAGRRNDRARNERRRSVPDHGARKQDPIADAWADAHGSLDGGTWECCDGPDFVYDILYWRPGLIEELQAERLRSQLLPALYEPGEEETAIATHAGECDACQGDYREAEKHLESRAACAK